MHGTCNLEHCFQTWSFHRKLNCLGKTFRRASHIWKIACESIFIYIIFEWFNFFFDCVTVNPNVAKQEGTAFVCKIVVLLLPPMTTCKYSSMPSNASVKSLSLMSTPPYSHRNYRFFSYLLRIYTDWSFQPFRDGFWAHLYWRIEIKDIFVLLERRRRI